MSNFYFHIITNILGLGIYCYRLNRRKFFLLRLSLTLAVYLVYSIGGVRQLQCIHLGNWFDYVSFTINWLMLFGGVMLCFDVNWITALFCATCGYAIQHISQRASILIIAYGLKLGLDSIPAILVRIVIILCILSLCLFTYKKLVNNTGGEPKIYNTWQLVLTSCSLIVTLYIETWMWRGVMKAELIVRIGVHIISILFTALVIILEYTLVLGKESRDENDELKRIMAVEHRQYEMEKSVMDTINIKCHDLKHQLIREGGKFSLEEMESTRKAISLYDSFYKTGNSALDTVLTMKGLICEDKNINFSCNVNGKSLSFMADFDIYSLFGNILDNCIEAVDPLPQPKRYIEINVRVKENFLLITTENEFEGGKVMKDGLPQTTKSNDLFHGFGLKSIKNIVHKYNGDMSINIEENIFKLSIMICL